MVCVLLASLNPDEVTRKFLVASTSMTLAEANSRAWDEGKRMLGVAIRGKTDFVFEATLGGTTMTELLSKALDEGLEGAFGACSSGEPNLLNRRRFLSESATCRLMAA